MAQQSREETLTLRLEEQISAAADRAGGALGRLERQIEREGGALGRLERDLVAARAKLDLVAQGTPSDKAVQAFERQAQVVDALRVKYAGLQSGTSQAAAALEKIATARAKLESMRAAAQGGVVDLAAYRKAEDAVAKLTARIEAQRDKIGALKDKANATRGATAQLGDASKMLGDKFGATNGQAAQLGQSIAMLGPYGAAAAVAVLAVVGAISAFVAVVSKAINSAGAMRAELLELQQASVSSSMGMHWLWNASRESTTQAEAMQAAIGRVAQGTARSRAELAKYGAQIIGARFQGEQAQKVLKAMASVPMDKSGEVLNWARAIRFAGGNVDALADRIEKKFGKTARAQAIALDVQMRRLGENITWIFGGADIDPFLRALNSVLSLFGAGTKGATTLRDSITKMTEWAISAMLRMGIHVLKAYIALRQHDTAWIMIGRAVKMVAVGFGVVFGIAAGLVGVLVGVAAALMAVQAAVVGLIASGFGKLIEMLSKVKGWGDIIGKAFTEGFAGGIRDGSTGVNSAAATMAGGAKASAEAKLEVRSPSRVGMRIGGFFGQGIGGGMRASEGLVARSAARVSTAAVMSSRAVVANDVRASFAPMMEPRFAARLSLPAPVPMVPPPPVASTHPTMEFNNCTFGGDLDETKVRQMLASAMEAESLYSRKAG